MLKEYFFSYKVKIDVFPRIENFLRVINCDLEEGERGEQWGIIFKPGFPVWLLRQGSFYYSADGTCDGVQCHANATCFKASPEQRGSCVCQDGWQGNGTHCQGEFDIMILLSFLNVTDL